MINFIKNICKNLGNNNKSIYPVIAIATANGICRPTFTMLKKGENPESKKYAALREGITEFIAVPTYWVSGVLAAKFGEKVASKAMDLHFKAQEKKGFFLANEVKQEMKSSAIRKGKAGLMLIGVCSAAGIIIPALCSVCVTPIMKRLKPKTENQPKKLDIKESFVPNIVVTQIKTPQKFIDNAVFKSNVSCSGMRVGGI